ncbi:hypothetical protein EDD28_1646 [Salana multivorans]|uniref:Short-subunit dehydrogenase n=1 Tax=Salana multivorans TaxID=120377 RepID=A0A3N2DBD3_9MICO|nr:SDR family oxidoreductase [Salana multivorans]ROR97053.1 hypothetical protein EDD28_1646 [Salana multivorans]
MTTALITGASAGLGTEFAWQLAESGHDLVLVARSVDRLETLAEQLRAAARVQVEVLPADLADPDQLALVVERVHAGSPAPVDVLVLNAGYGLGATFHRTAPGVEEAALAVMVTSVLVLARAAVEEMVPRGRGTIITVGSVAGLMASGTYSAHKAWVRTFTEGLGRSLRGTGVTATVVNPGLTRTEFHDRAGWRASGFPRWAWLSASDVVADTLAAARAGRVEVTPSLRYRAASWLLRHLPRGVVRRISRSF